MASAIKVFTNTDKGAPQLYGQQGQMIAVLNAALRDGYGQVNVTSINRSGATATAICQAPHGLSTGDSALIGGATQSDYNIDTVVTVIDPTTLTFPVANSPATPATGTITLKRAPAGFSTPYTGTNLAVYRSNDLTSDRAYLQLTDNGSGTGGARECLFRAYESMTSVSAGTNPFPTVGQFASGYMMSKSSSVDTVARPWTIIADSQFFYMVVTYNAVETQGVTQAGANYTFCFGDIVSNKVGDIYKTIISGQCAQNLTTSLNGGFADCESAIIVPATPSACIARDTTATALSKGAGFYGNGSNSTCLGSMVMTPFPNIPDGGFYVTPVIVTQSIPTCIRGKMPGLFESLHGFGTHYGGDIIEGVSGLSGRKLRALPVRNTSNDGLVFMDITGPWR